MSVLYDARLRAAQRLAEAAHRGQRRKGDADLPYVLHPVAVAAALAAAGASADVVCAGYLHDVVEDTPVTIEEIGLRFGPRVAALVASVTEEKRRPGTGEPVPWEERKAAALAHLRATDDAEALALKGADLLVNLTDILLDHEDEGDAVWQRFRRGRDAQLAFYGEAAGLVVERVGLPVLAAALADARARLLALAGGSG